MVFQQKIQYKKLLDSSINIYIISSNEDLVMKMKQWRCVVTLSTGWKTETFVYSLDQLTAMKLAEAQTGGKCNAAFEVK